MRKVVAHRTGAGLIILAAAFAAADASALVEDRLLDETEYLDLSTGASRGGFWFDRSSEAFNDQHTRLDDPGNEIPRATFAMEQDHGDLSLRWGAARGEYQQLREAGVAIHGLGISAFSGDGRSVSDVNHAWEGAGNFHFHGGINHDYDFDGMQLAWRPGGSSSIALTRASIRSTGLEKRAVTQLDLGLDGHSLTLLEVESGGGLAGRAFGLGTRIGPLALSLQHMAAGNDATWSSLGLFAHTRKGKTLEMRIEQRRNPLYDAANDNRVVFRFGYTIAGGALLRATGAGTGDGVADPEAEETETAPSSKTTVALIAAGAVGAALALSSGGGSDADSRPRFDTQNAAARHILNEVNPPSVRENREYGGWIYRSADGSYSSSEAVRGGPASVQLPPSGSSVPSSASVTANYHTHAAYDPRYLNEQFSPQDLRNTLSLQVDGYLATPEGRFLYANYRQQRIYELGGPGTIATQ